MCAEGVDCSEKKGVRRGAGDSGTQRKVKTASETVERNLLDVGRTRHGIPDAMSSRPLSGDHAAPLAAPFSRIFEQATVTRCYTLDHSSFTNAGRVHEHVHLLQEIAKPQSISTQSCGVVSLAPSLPRSLAFPSARPHTKNGLKCLGVEVNECEAVRPSHQMPSTSNPISH